MTQTSTALTEISPALHAMGESIQTAFAAHEPRATEVLAHYRERTTHWSWTSEDLANLLEEDFEPRDCFPKLPDDVKRLSVAAGLALCRQVRGVALAVLGAEKGETNYRHRVHDMINSLFPCPATYRNDTLRMMREESQNDTGVRVKKIATDLSQSPAFVSTRLRGRGVLWPCVVRHSASEIVSGILG